MLDIFSKKTLSVSFRDGYLKLTQKDLDILGDCKEIFIFFFKNKSNKKSLFLITAKDFHSDLRYNKTISGLFSLADTSGFENAKIRVSMLTKSNLLKIAKSGNVRTYSEVPFKGDKVDLYFSDKSAERASIFLNIFKYLQNYYK